VGVVDGHATLMLDVIDGLRDLLSDRLDIETDDTGDRPYDWTAGVLYVWEESSGQISIGTGEVREEFVVMAAIASPSGEEAAGQKLREVTETLDGYRDTFLTRIRLNSNIGPWASGTIIGASVPNYLRQLDLRGIAVRISGYRIIE
jgi:hypothetical protein